MKTFDDFGKKYGYPEDKKKWDYHSKEAEGKPIGTTNGHLEVIIYSKDKLKQVPKTKIPVPKRRSSETDIFSPSIAPPVEKAKRSDHDEES